MIKCHVIVAGPVASGKTRTAYELAGRLQTAVLSKDRLKETMWESLRPQTEADSLRLSRAAMDLLYDIAENSATGLVLEANWRAEFDLLRLQKLTLPLVQIYCYAPVEMLRHRLLARVESGERHPVHRDVMSPEVLKAMVTSLEQEPSQPLPLDCPLIRVDSTTSVNWAEVAQWVIEESVRHS